MRCICLCIAMQLINMHTDTAHIISKACMICERAHAVQVQPINISDMRCRDLRFQVKNDPLITHKVHFLRDQAPSISITPAHRCIFCVAIKCSAQKIIFSVLRHETEMESSCCWLCNRN